MNPASYSPASYPKKVSEKRPVYDMTPPCPQCGSLKTFPYMNMPGSRRQCTECKTEFQPSIIRYEKCFC